MIQRSNLMALKYGLARQTIRGCGGNHNHVFEMNGLVSGLRPWHHGDHKRFGIEVVDGKHQHRSQFVVDLTSANGTQFNEINFTTRDRGHLGDLQAVDEYQDLS
ncbi:hypothetical protein AYO44_10870 [Planctomycetaceae bacterium SCGC AG-212-F19]|nr:hypothetical protein AYO44_10870 [Planctomycetaceae bacterium SCGC AG-212-F19]